MPNRDYQNQRRDYGFAELTKKKLSPSPIKQFALWMDHALKSGIKDPTAMSLATVSKEGLPKSRVLLLKFFSEQGFVFYTNYKSQKGQDLTHSPNGALLFFWPELDRQVRIEGRIQKTTAENSNDYFLSRPIQSQMAATLSEQSKRIKDRAYLEQRLTQLSDQTQTIKRPEHWGGYVLSPNYFEFWQGRPNRLHDRFCYQAHADSKWHINRLAP